VTLQVGEWDSYKVWMDHLSEKELTKQAYKHLFAEFVEWIEQSPNQLINLVSTDQASLETKIRKYIQHLADEGRHICTQESAYYAIQSFFEYNHHTVSVKALPYTSTSCC
jgi:site-specific recombinase XerD